MNPTASEADAQQQPQPRTITSSEQAQLGSEQAPVYANFVREAANVPPPAQGGDRYG